MKFQKLVSVVIASILLAFLAGCANTAPPTEQPPPELEVIGDYDGYMYAYDNRSPILLTVEAGPNAQGYSVILDFVDGGAIRHQCGPIASDSTIDCNAVDGVGSESTLRGTFDGDTFDGTYRLRDRQGNVVSDATFETEKR